MELEQALRQYLTGGGDREGHQSELIRFVRWCGRQRDIGSLTSDEVAEYAQFAAGSSTDGQRRLAPVREFLAFAHAGGYTVQNVRTDARPPRSTR